MRSAIAVLVVSVLAMVAAQLPVAAQTTSTPVPSAATAAAATTAPAAGDTQSSRTVNRIVVALLALAVLLLVFVIWLWRTTKPAPSHLDGLDAMSTRRWRDASEADRAVMLAPVHARRSDLRDEDLIAAPDEEPAVAAADDEQLLVPDEVDVPLGTAAEDADPVAVEAPPLDAEALDAEAPSTPLA